MNDACIKAMLIAAGLSCAASAQNQNIINDPPGDAVIRRTDPNLSGSINPMSLLPDVTRIRFAGWSSPTASTDPYTGSVVNPDGANLFRLDITFEGVINPPGPVGLAGQPYDPFKFGQSPVYGFVEIDVDDRKDSGGELGGAAWLRYLANVSRFGRLPYGSISERVPENACEYDLDFYSPPQYERSGADFALSLCGCYAVTVLSGDANFNGVFDAGETWIVRGRFFERSQGYVGASSCFGGSAFGHYDPWSNLRFSHDPVKDETTVSLVYALDMKGASQLAGQPQQSVDLNVANHTSIVEGLQDIIDGASGNLTGPVYELARHLEGRDPEDYIDCTDWRFTAIFGMAYSQPEDTLFAWTDTLGDEKHGDVDSDGNADDIDAAIVRAEVYARDGGPSDADGVKNGAVQIFLACEQFSLYDLDGDGFIDGEDLWVYGHRADLDKNGMLDLFDFLVFTNLFVALDPIADFNLDETHDLFDFLAFVNAFQK